MTSELEKAWEALGRHSVEGRHHNSRLAMATAVANLLKEVEPGSRNGLREGLQETPGPSLGSLV